MRAILDTHIWLWWIADPERLTRPYIDLITDQRNELFLSAVSTWEIAIKYGLGRLVLPEPPDRFIPPRLQRDGIVALPISVAHTLEVASLPSHHKDPFDRLLVAQARVEQIPIVTTDQEFQKYDVVLA